MIRNARMGDIKKIYKLLQYFADKDLLLGRSLSSLYDQLRDFTVFVEKEQEDPDRKALSASAPCILAGRTLLR